MSLNESDRGRYTNPVGFNGFSTYESGPKGKYLTLCAFSLFPHVRKYIWNELLVPTGENVAGSTIKVSESFWTSFYALLNPPGSTYRSQWAGRRPVRWEKRTACREWWRWQWNREAAAASGNDKWCPGTVCRDSRCSKPSVSSSCSPLTPIHPTPWSYWGQADHCPKRRIRNSVYPNLSY